MSIVYLNGTYLPIEKATVSVMDRGFLLGDGVYEVIPVFAGRLFRYEEHIVRLKNSLSLIRLDFDTDTLTHIFTEMIEKNGGGDQSLYVQITRGCDPNSVRKHVFPPASQPTLFISSSSLRFKNKAELAEGAKAITLPDTRWQLCNIKAITLLANVLATQTAQDAGAIDAILVRDGFALEGSTSNLFMVKKGVLITPPISEHILGGITRSFVLELAHQNNIPVQERNIHETELATADELWFTSSTKDIVPILTLNEKTMSGGKPGPLWEQMIDLYLVYRQQLSTT